MRDAFYVEPWCLAFLKSADAMGKMLEPRPQELRHLGCGKYAG